MNKKVLSTVGVLATAAVSAVSAFATPSMVSAYGNTGKTRRDYTVDEINSKENPVAKLKDGIVFNSISDGYKYGEDAGYSGHEFNYVGAQLCADENSCNRNGMFNLDEIDVNKDGSVYMLRMYVHNNSRSQIAHNVSVEYSIPTTASTTVEVNGIINTTSGPYAKYWDYVRFANTEGRAFHLEYIEDSAVLYNNIYENGIKLSNDIAKAGSTNGAKIGYQTMNGDLPGCYQYSAYVYAKVRVVYDDYKLEKQVRKVGETTWHDTVETKLGDEVEFRFIFQNLGKSVQNDVIALDSLPNNMEYVPGSMTITNGNFPKGEKVTNAEALFAKTGLNIGSYAERANVQIKYRAKVIDNSLACGKNQLFNWVQAKVTGGYIVDSANVTLDKVCAPEDKPEELPSTGPVSIMGGVVATGAVVTALGYLISSRRARR